MHKEEMIVVSVPSKKFTYNTNFDLTLPLIFVGELLAYTQLSQQFEVAGCTIKVPSKTSSNDNKLRTLSVLKQLVNVAFGEMDTEEIAEDEQLVAFCTGITEWLARYDIKLISQSKTGVMEAIDIWYKGKKEQNKLIVQDTRKANAVKWLQYTANRKRNSLIGKQLLQLSNG